MARGSMQYETTTIGGKKEILNRAEFEAVPVTLNFASVSTTEPETGKKIVKAGTPVNKSGVKATATGDVSDVLGILLFDVYEERPQGTALKKAYLNTTYAQSHSGVTYDVATKAALPMVVFE